MSPFLSLSVRGCAIRIAIALALASPSHAQMPSLGPLTLEDAQHQAVARSRLLAAQDFAITASREMAVAAGQLPDPVLRFGIDNLPTDGPDRFSIGRDFMTMRRIGVMQELTGARKRELRSARAELDAAKTLEEKNAAIANIRRDTAIAWLDRYYAEAMAAVVSTQLAHAALEIEGAEGAYRSGRGTSADILAAFSAQVMLEDRASELRRRSNSAKANLARWLGDAAQAPLSGQPMLDSLRLDVQALEAELDHHPQITVLARQEDIARADVRLAEANKNSDWTVELNYAVRGSSFSNMLSLGFSIPLQWDQTNRQDREVNAKRALVDQAAAQKDDVLRQHVAETRAMLAEWQSGRERQKRLQRELVPLASERTEALVGTYRAGKAALTEVLAARRNELDVRLQVLQLEADTARVWAQLNFLFPDDGVTQLHFRRKELK